MVADRLAFLTLFESIVYLDPYETRVKERSQLHRLIAPNTWLFGEEYALGTDDENLEAILKKHINILGRRHLQPELSDDDISDMIAAMRKERTKTPESLARIPDLMLWRRFVERRPEEYEFLVVELKRPGVAIGRNEIAQIEDYARAVVSTPFADKDCTQWVFLLVSDTLNEYAEQRSHQSGLPANTIHRPANGNYEIRVVPWSQVIRAARARHEHLQKWLNYAVTQEHVAELAEETYAEFLPINSRMKSEETKRSRRRSKTAPQSEVK